MCLHHQHPWPQLGPLHQGTPPSLGEKKKRNIKTTQKANKTNKQKAYPAEASPGDSNAMRGTVPRWDSSLLHHPLGQPPSYTAWEPITWAVPVGCHAYVWAPTPRFQRAEIQPPSSTERELGTGPGRGSQHPTDLPITPFTGCESGKRGPRSGEASKLSSPATHNQNHTCRQGSV